MELNRSKAYGIDEIEQMTFADAFILGDEIEEVKGHDVIFMDIAGAFGFSAIVFKDCRQVKYCNQYELHFRHMNYSRQELKKRYLDILNDKLFEESELASVADYEDYRQKSDFLRDHYACRVHHVSIFGQFNDPENVRKHEEATKNLVYDPVGLCYVESADFVKHHVDLMQGLEEAWEEKSRDFETIKQAFINEMYNHEYCINWEADWDTINAFKNVEYIEDGSTSDYCKAAGFTDTETRAYFEAKSEVNANWKW